MPVGKILSFEKENRVQPPLLEKIIEQYKNVSRIEGKTSAAIYSQSGIEKSATIYLYSYFDSGELFKFQGRVTYFDKDYDCFLVANVKLKPVSFSSGLIYRFTTVNNLGIVAAIPRYCPESGKISSLKWEFDDVNSGRFLTPIFNVNSRRFLTPIFNDQRKINLVLLNDAKVIYESTAEQLSRLVTEEK